jgi:hypothetical protein
MHHPPTDGTSDLFQGRGRSMRGTRIESSSSNSSITLMRTFKEDGEQVLGEDGPGAQALEEGGGACALLPLAEEALEVAQALEHLIPQHIAAGGGRATLSPSQSHANREEVVVHDGIPRRPLGTAMAHGCWLAGVPSWGAG